MKKNTIQATLYALTFVLAAGLGIAKSFANDDAFAGEQLVVSSSDLSPSIKLSDLLGSYRIEKGPTDCSSELVISLKQDNLYKIKFSEKKAVTIVNEKDHNTGYLKSYESSDFSEGVEHSFYKKVITSVSALNQNTLKVMTETHYADCGPFYLPLPNFGSKQKIELFKLNGTKLEYKLDLKRIDGEVIKLTCKYTKV